MLGRRIPQLLDHGRDGEVRPQRVDLAAGDVIGNGVGEPDLGAGRRDACELGGVRSDEHRFDGAPRHRPSR